MNLEFIKILKYIEGVLFQDTLIYYYITRLSFLGLCVLRSKPVHVAKPLFL